MIQLPDTDVLKALLEYDPSTGVFTRKTTRGRFRKGDACGCLGEGGYVYIRLEGRLYRAHRLAWKYVHGLDPTAEIDHINHVRHDNRIGNLRPATRKQNSENLPKARASTGFRNVYRNGNTFTVQLGHKGKKQYLGSYPTANEADLVAQAGRARLFTHHKETLECIDDSINS